MPKYEQVLNNMNNLSDIDVLKCIIYINTQEKTSNKIHNDPKSLNIDSTGKRIKTYKGVCLIIQQLNNIRQCASGYVAKEKKVYFVNHIQNELKTEKIKKFITYFHSL